MKFVVVLCVFALAALASARPNEEKYTDKYDNIDLDEILANKRLLLPYIKCVLDQGKCTPEGKELRDHIADALETECAKCSEKQKEGTKKVIKHMINNEKDYWNEITTKYDPDKKYSAKYEKELREVQE